VLPAAYVVESKGMVGSVVGLVASLLSLAPSNRNSPLAARSPG
jgi:hypothetical protein